MTRGQPIEEKNQSASANSRVGHEDENANKTCCVDDVPVASASMERQDPKESEVEVTTAKEPVEVDGGKEGGDGDGIDSYSVLALYKFFILPAPVDQIKQQLEDFLRVRRVRGLLLLASEEGINGTISYPTIHDYEIQNFLKQTICSEQEDLANNNTATPDPNDDRPQQHENHQYQKLRLCVSHNNSAHVFHRLKIKVKKEIVSMLGGVPLRQVFPKFLTKEEMAKEDANSRPFSQQEQTSSGSRPKETPEYTLDKRTTPCGPGDDGDEKIPIPSPTQPVVGKYVKPGTEWHALINDPNCWVIDMRNEYEIALGTFPNATNPGTNSFTEFPSWFQQQLSLQQPLAQEKEPPTQQHEVPSSASPAPRKDNPDNHKTQTPPKTFDKIAMFCTGGIRCEKASAYCLQQLSLLHNQLNQPADKNNDNNPTATAIPPVYHLEGGILSYLKNVPPQDSQWQGDCYVFDQRIAVTQGLQPSKQYGTSCFACRHPLTNIELQSSHYQQGVACPYCWTDPSKQERLSRYSERQLQIQISQQRQIKHIHDPKEINK